ncbi:MAG: insulinase family protein [Bacteroidales bacterium]|nr:insulinase family protein [Bacteroidales bacterium]
MVQRFTLPDGLRVILAPSATNVVYAGVAVGAGTRHELQHESGMAHFVEHMSFKGTRHLTSVQILNRMESVGGDLNAYTGKEETIYYTTFLREHLQRAIPLLLDIVFSSTYPQEELEKEREVVIDEIESYNDSPAELIYDDFEALLFPNHPLGRNILGDAERLRQYTSADLHAFTQRCYSPQRAVLFVKGNVQTEELLRILRQSGKLTKDFSPATHATAGAASKDNGGCPGSGCLSDHPGTALHPASGPSLIHLSEHTTAGTTTVVNKNCHQSHVMLGARAYAITDPRRMGLALLNNLLGGPAMNSRLSLALRERTGLVYTVESSLSAYSDTGVWAVYFGCDHADVKRCLRIVRRELQRLLAAPLSARALEAARRQLKGQMGIAADSFENVALSMAKYYLLTGESKTLEERFAELDALTPEYLYQIALDIFNTERITTLIYK